MKIENLYIASGFKKSAGSNMKSFMLLIPFYTLVLTVLLSVMMPTYNHKQFVENGNYRYVYLQQADDTVVRDYKNLILSNPQTNLMSHKDPELDKGTRHYYKYRGTADLLLCRSDVDLSNTMYNDANVLQKIEDGGENYAWISYEMAKELNVGLGDEIYFTMIPTDSMLLRDVAIRVTGLTRTKYDDLKPTKGQNTYEPAVIFFDADTFQYLMEHTMARHLSSVIFSERALPIENGSELSLYMAKELQQENLKAYLHANLLQFVGMALGGALFLFLVTSMDLNFTRKRQQRNLTILNMLGMPISAIRRILLKTAILNSTIAFIVAFLLVKFVFLQELFSTYADVGFLLVCFLGYWVLSVVFCAMQTCQIKRV